MHALRSARRISSPEASGLVLELGIGFQELELRGVELALQVGDGLGLPRHVLPA